MSNNCTQNDVKKQASLDPREAIKVVGGNDITVDVEDDGSSITYTVNYQEHLDPTIVGGVDVPITKVGINVPAANFNGNIVKGSKDILSRIMTPDKGLDLNNPFVWTETSIKGEEPGLFPQFSGAPTTVEVRDVQGNTVTKQFGVEYRHLFYMGFSAKDTLSEADIKGLANQTLETSILNPYRSYTYNYSLAPVYIYWVFPADSPAFSTAAEGPLPVPLFLTHSSVNITDAGVTKTYKVIRTSVKSKLVNAEITLA